MTRYALRFRDGTIEVRRVADDAEIARFQARGDREIFVFGFSPDGRYLATTHVPGRALTVWDIDRRAVAVNDPGPVIVRRPGSARTAGVSPSAPSRMGRSSSTTWRPDSPASRLARHGAGGPGVSCRMATQIAVIDDESRTQPAGFLERTPGRLVRSIPLRRGAASPGAPTAPRWRRRATIQDLPLGRRHRHAGRRPSKAHANGGLDCGLPPRRHIAGQQRLGRPAAALGPGPGPAHAERDRRSATTEFSQDGRIVVSLEDRLTTYQVDPALEYRTLAHAVEPADDYLTCIDPA